MFILLLGCVATTLGLVALTVPTLIRRRQLAHHEPPRELPQPARSLVDPVHSAKWRTAIGLAGAAAGILLTRLMGPLDAGDTPRWVLTLGAGLVGAGALSSTLGALTWRQLAAPHRMAAPDAIEKDLQAVARSVARLDQVTRDVRQELHRSRRRAEELKKVLALENLLASDRAQAEGSLAVAMDSAALGEQALARLSDVGALLRLDGLVSVLRKVVAVGAVPGDTSAAERVEAVLTALRAGLIPPPTSFTFMVEAWRQADKDERRHLPGCVAQVEALLGTARLNALGAVSSARAASTANDLIAALCDLGQRTDHPSAPVAVPESDPGGSEETLARHVLDSLQAIEELEART